MMLCSWRFRLNMGSLLDLAAKAPARRPKGERDPERN